MSPTKSFSTTVANIVHVGQHIYHSLIEECLKIYLSPGSGKQAMDTNVLVKMRSTKWHRLAAYCQTAALRPKFLTKVIKLSVMTVKHKEKTIS